MGNTTGEVIKMAKQGMKRPEVTHTKPRNAQAAVPEIQGKAKSGKIKANPVIAGTNAPGLKVCHVGKGEKPISEAYPVIDSDIGRDNLETDIPEADLHDI